MISVFLIREESHPQLIPCQNVVLQYAVPDAILDVEVMVADFTPILAPQMCPQSILGAEILTASETESEFARMGKLDMTPASTHDVSHSAWSFAYGS